MVSVSAHSAGAYTGTLLVMVNVIKGCGCAVVHPPPAPAWANFTLMMECTPESSRCYSVYSVVLGYPLSLIPLPVFVKGKVAFSGPPKCRQRAFRRTSPFILLRFGGFTKNKVWSIFVLLRNIYCLCRQLEGFSVDIC